MRARCERFAKRNSKVGDHLLSRKRSTSDKRSASYSHPKLVVKVPAPFCYTSDKTVPWNYTSQIVTPELQAIVEQKLKKSVNNIARMGSMTHSGQCYAPITSGAKEGEGFTKNKGIKIVASKRKDKEPINEPVTELEADEFLNFIKHSEYSIVE